MNEELIWLQVSDAAYVAHEANPKLYPDPKDDQLGNSLRAAGRDGRIKTRKGPSGKPYYQKASVEEWVNSSKNHFGRGRSQVQAEIEGKY